MLLWRAAIAGRKIDGAGKKDKAFYEGQMKSAEYFIKSVLPPGLEPRGNNVVTAMVCRFQGGSADPFIGGAI